MRSLIIALAALSLAGCGSTVSPEDEVSEYADETPAEAGSSPDLFSYGAPLPEQATDEREPFDEDAAREDAMADVTAEGYSGPCTIDCSGHDAGFAYAAEGNPDGGLSRSPSFDEGQVAFEEAVGERVEEARQAYEDGEEL